MALGIESLWIGRMHSVTRRLLGFSGLPSDFVNAPASELLDLSMLPSISVTRSRWALERGSPSLLSALSERNVYSNMLSLRGARLQGLPFAVLHSSKQNGSFPKHDITVKKRNE